MSLDSLYRSAQEGALRYGQSAANSYLEKLCMWTKIEVGKIFEEMFRSKRNLFFSEEQNAGKEDPHSSEATTLRMKYRNSLKFEVVPASGNETTARLIVSTGEMEFSGFIRELFDMAFGNAKKILAGQGGIL